MNNDTIQKINFFENITHAKVKDILDDDKLIVIVENGELRKALGKNNANLNKIERLFRKKLRIIEYDDDPVKFIKHYTYPLKIDEVTLNNNILEIRVTDRTVKGLLIGREGRNLNKLNSLMKDYFNLEIKIL